MTSTTATTVKAAPLTMEQAEARLAVLLAQMTEANKKMTEMSSMNPIPYTEFSALSAESNAMRNEFDKVTKRIISLKEKQEKVSAVKPEAASTEISDEAFAMIQEAIESAGLTIVEFTKSAQVKELVNAARATRASPEETKLRLAKALRYVRQGFPQSVAADKAGVTTQQMTANKIVTNVMTFVNPADKSVTWTSGGKGQFPSWFNAHIKAGGLPIELTAGFVADTKAEDEYESAPY